MALDGNRIHRLIMMAPTPRFTSLVFATIYFSLHANAQVPVYEFLRELDRPSHTYGRCFFQARTKFDI